jgi:hypothetical protein
MTPLEFKLQKIKHEAELATARAVTECKILESLPIVPDFVHIYPLYGSVGSARYNAKSLKHALEIFKSFTVAPSYVVKSNNTVSIKPIDDEKADESTECLAIVEIEKHDQSLRFYTSTPEGLVRVHIAMGFNPFGCFHIDDPKKRGYYKWVFRPTNLLGALRRVVSYAPVSSFGEMSSGHYLYAAYEMFEIEEQLGEAA